MRGVWIRKWVPGVSRVWDEAPGPNTGWEQDRINLSNATARKDARMQEVTEGRAGKLPKAPLTQ